jgi:hypothetical protein
MRTAFVFLLATSLLGAAAPQAPNSLSPKEVADGWILLFDGESLFGWTAEGGSNWRAVNGVLTADGQTGGWLRTNAVFGDYLLQCEFRSGAEASGIHLRSGSGRPGYALPGARGKAAANGWHSYQVNVSGSKFTVTLDGKRIAGGQQGPDAVGAIGLEHKADNKVEYRNIKLKPLGSKPVFDGKSLQGWQKLERTPAPPQPPEWSVKDGMIHVEKGPGELITEPQWANFVLQLDVRTNTSDPNRHPNSGVFVRGTPGVFWSGYEAQIRNEYKGGDRTQPVDFGTGGIYHYQPARKVVSNDNEFFTMTVAAHERHIAVWVNGYAVSDWTDPNPPGEDVRKKQAKLSPGTIGLQAHDPTTNLDFKNIRVVELPAR